MNKFYVKYDNGHVEPFIALVREEEGEPNHYFISNGKSHVGGGRLARKYCTKIAFEIYSKTRR